MRVGVIAKKVGMSAVFDQNGNRTPVTILKIDDCQVIGHKTMERDGYVAVRIGAGNTTAKKLGKNRTGDFAKNNLEPKRKIVEFRVSEDSLVDIGTNIKADHYITNQFIDVSGVSIGKGFAGVIKRHNFGGLRASHGVSISHRSHGSTGQRQDPGKVFKNKKMAGHMGDDNITVQNLRIVGTDIENNLLIVKGAIPGSKNAYVVVNDAHKRALPAEAPYPCKKEIINNTQNIVSTESNDSTDVGSAE